MGPVLTDTLIGTVNNISCAIAIPTSLNDFLFIHCYLTDSQSYLQPLQSTLKLKLASGLRNPIFVKYSRVGSDCRLVSVCVAAEFSSGVWTPA